MSDIMAMFNAISQGLAWAILAMGVYITFRILNFADMSCEGTFALGGSLSAMLMVRHGWNPFISMYIAIFAGMLAGLITGILHTKLKIPAILSGILTMISLYSINLVIMGQSNTALIGQETIVSKIQAFFPSAQELGIKNSTLQTWVTILIGLVFTVIAVFILYWFFGTEIGSCIRATGNNGAMVRAQGVNTDTMIILGLVLSNGLISFSGALVTQTQGYADINMGVGAIVIALASIVIGEVVFQKFKHFGVILVSLVIGSILYRIIVAWVLQRGLNTNYLKLLTAIIVTIALSVPRLKKNKVKGRKGAINNVTNK
ncbi:MAG: ABC transporter permease [Clostridiales bacterium]|nr:ABC transporter permease [Clostridiales bacterium]